MRTIEGIEYKSGQELVDETISMYNDFRDKRYTWASQAQENTEFRLNIQYSKEQEEAIEARGNAAIVNNRIHPAVEMAKALLTSRRPGFNVVGREDSDVKTAKVFSELVKYVWDISDGDSVMRAVIDDYYVKGMGCILAYIDPLADNGKGEVKIRDIDPLNVYIEPNCRDKFCNDGDIIISELTTKREAMSTYYYYKNTIEGANGDWSSDRPIGNNTGSETIFFPEMAESMNIGGLESDDYIRKYERYSHVFFDRFRIYESWTQRELVLTDEEYKEYISKPAWIVNNQVLTDPESVQKVQEEYKMILQQADQQEIPVDEIPELKIEEVTMEELYGMELLEVVKVPVRRVVKSVIFGDKHLYTQIMPVENHLLITLMNIHTRTPYPVADISLAKDMQRYINKIRSLIIAHATTATNMKVLIPTGSIDKEEFEREWARPGVGIEVDMDLGVPVVAQPTPLPSELYNNEAMAKADIDHLLGIYEMMAGNSAAAPHTYKATLAMDEFGQRKIGSKLKDIESALKALGRVIVSLCQEHYTIRKTFRIVQPNNSMTEYAINNKMYDDKSGEISTINDITKGSYDITVVSGSTLPNNRYMELELYMEAYKNGLIDNVEVLKKTDIFDMEGVLERSDMTNQLKGMVQQQQEEIKRLKGDMQTRDRQVKNLSDRVNVEKTKSKLKEAEIQAKHATALYGERLNDQLTMTDKVTKLNNK